MARTAFLQRAVPSFGLGAGAGLLLVLVLAGPEGKATGESGPGMRSNPSARFQELKLAQVEIEDEFWSPRIERLRTVTLPAQWEELEAHHHLDNFRVAAGKKPGVHLGPVFLDSDLYKWLEAAAYVLARHPQDQELARRVEEISDLIAQSQMPDGYLNTYYQSLAPERRWVNLLMNHELYCAGHFIEAACARTETSGKNSLLPIAEKLADHLVATFGPGRNEGVPGHEEIELALIRLYRQTGKPEYLELADFFVHQRGRNPHFARDLVRALCDQARLNSIVQEKRKPYLFAAAAEDTSSYGAAVIPPRLLPRILANFYTGRYFQAEKPLEQQTVAVGHAVRAMYFYTGAADLYLETGEPGLLAALKTIWDNTIARRTYITGGMGALPVIEGFGRDYELPNRSYTETCAAIGSFFFSWRLLRATGEAQYAEQMERTLYNAILSGISLDQRHYFYGNPLTSHGEHERREWFLVACCPPNLARVLASLERYLYGQSEDGVWVHQYVGGRVRFPRPEGEAALRVESGFPWQGKARLQMEVERPMRFALRLRVPAWAKQAQVRVNGKAVEEKAVPGTYAVLDRDWQSGDVVELEFRMETEAVFAPPPVKENRGRAAIMRGPLVYCLEDKDNAALDVHRVKISPEPQWAAGYQPELLGGLVAVSGRTREGARFRAIPYYAWGNRGRANMAVWLI
jgi:hypothetical protein